MKKVQINSGYAIVKGKLSIQLPREKSTKNNQNGIIKNLLFKALTAILFVPFVLAHAPLNMANIPIFALSIKTNRLTIK